MQKRIGGFVVLVISIFIVSANTLASFPFTGVFISDDVLVNDMVMDREGSVYITGRTTGPGENYNSNYGTIKYDNKGNKLWMREYDGPFKGFDYANSISVDSKNNVYVTGDVQLDEKTNGLFLKGYATIKYDSDGNELWAAVSKESSFKADAALVVGSDESVYVSGRCKKGENDDFITLKYDKNGKELWVDYYNGPDDGSDAPVDIAIDDSNYLYITGRSLNRDINYEFATIKYSPDGKRCWTARHKHEDKSCPLHAMTVDNSGNVFVTGDCTDYDKYSFIVTVKYDAEGHEVWSNVYKKSGRLVSAHDIFLDQTGNIYISGYADNNLVIIKYDNAGKQQWDVWHKQEVLHSYSKFCGIRLEQTDYIYRTAFTAAENKYSWTQPVIAKYDKKGKIAWVKPFDNISELIKLWGKD